MNARNLLLLLASVILALLLWELRWVMLVLFGAVVLAVALDVPVSWLRRLIKPLNRPTALLIVLALLFLPFVLLPTGHWHGLDRRLHARYPASPLFR